VPEGAEPVKVPSVEDRCKTGGGDYGARLSAAAGLPVGRHRHQDVACTSRPADEQEARARLRDLAGDELSSTLPDSSTVFGALATLECPPAFSNERLFWPNAAPPISTTRP